MNRLAAVLLAVLGCATGRAAPQSLESKAAPLCRCTPEQPCWPSAAEWRAFGATLHGKLEQPPPVERSTNPFALQDQSGGTQSAGWLGAWDAAASTYAVVAEDAFDIAAAVSFAREHRLRLVIKGTGHDYLGRSNAPRSLLVWTHKMRRVESLDAFVPHGCQAPEAGQVGTPAVTVEAGTRWIEAYQEVTVKRGRYVQGGGCTTVGAAGGFLQGGGFGSWSKKYGTAAANLLEAEVVTADGKLLVANRCQNQDLFWALRGGGGGTFGVVTKVVLMTHALPDFFGYLEGRIAAKSDDAFKELIERFLIFYRQNLSNEHWGEQVKVRHQNALEFSLSFQGLGADEVKQLWRPFREWVSANDDRYEMKLESGTIPGAKMWDAALLKQLPGAITLDDRLDQPADRFWWTGDGDQVFLYWYAYQSRWIPLSLFDSPKSLASTLFEASRHWSVGIHFNKGQAGAAADAVQRGRETSTNPALFDAAALVIVASGDRQPDAADGEKAKAGVSAAMKVIRDATPGAGSYVNETDWFEPDWQQSFWGGNYQRLLDIKRKYDPDGLFVCHHCVGSEGWSDDGICKKN